MTVAPSRVTVGGARSTRGTADAPRAAASRVKRAPKDGAIPTEYLCTVGWGDWVVAPILPSVLYARDASESDLRQRARRYRVT